MLSGLADYHRKRTTDGGEMPAVGDGHPPLFEFFNDDDVPPPPAPHRLSINQGTTEALDIQRVEPKSLSDHHTQVIPVPTTVISVKPPTPTTQLNKRTSIHHISPPTTAVHNQRRRSTTTVTPVKKSSSILKRCCQILCILLIIAIILVVGGMILEGKVLRFFSCSSAPYCPFGSAMLSTTTGNQSTHAKALQIVLDDEYACRNECESIPSCVRAVFAGAEGNKCYLELTDAVDSSGQSMTCLKSRNQARDCPTNMLCKGWIKMCLCPQLDQEIDYATTKTLLDDVAFVLQCTSTDINAEDYISTTCVPNSEQ